MRVHVIPTAEPVVAPPLYESTLDYETACYASGRNVSPAKALTRKRAKVGMLQVA